MSKNNHPILFSIFLFFALLFTLSISGQEAKRVLQVGADYAYYPYEFTNEFNQADGFDIDIIKALSNEMGVDIEINSGNWFNIKNELEKGNLDLVAGMYYLPDRAEKVNFSMPFIIITHSIFVNQGDYWQSLKDVKDQTDLKVVVENSSILHKYLTTAGISSNRIIPVENQLDALKILSETANTCALLPELQGQYIARKNGFDHIKTVGLPILPREYSVAVNKNDTILLNRINDAITTINQNGTYLKIYNKWFGQFDESKKSFSYINYLITGLGLLLLLSIMIIIYLNNRFRVTLKHNQVKIDQEHFLKEELKKKIEKSEAILRKITDNTPYPIAIINYDQIFIYLNRQFEDEFGLTRKDVYNLDNWLNMCFPNSDHHVAVLNVLKRIKSNNHIGFENRTESTETLDLLKKDKSFAKIIIRIVAIGDGQTLFFFEDITKQVEHEKKLSAAKIKAESADKLKSSFLANISHEIRTPMNAIIGFSSLIAEDEISRDDKNLYSNLIKKNGHVLMLLIQDIIDFSKIEAGKLDIFPKLIESTDLVKDAFNIIKEDYAIKIPRPIKFNLNISKEFEQKQTLIRVDPSRFSQVLNNLLTNAFKYTDKGSIELGMTMLSNSKIRYYIKDTGIGIKKENHTLIFNRFSRVEESNVQLRGGTGLGLAITYQILKLFGTSLQMESEVDQGSHFYFDLPYYEGQNKSIDENLKNEPYRAPKEYNWMNKTILVVEDNPENTTYIRAILDRTYCHTIFCMNGDEALEEIRSNDKIDFILLDWLLPDMTGEKIVNEAKSKNSKTPILVLTALALNEDKIDILNKNVDDYLAKPFDKNILVQKIHILMNKKS